MKLVQDLKNFALRGNIFDLAVGFTVGAAFTTIAKSFVDDIIAPPISLLLGRTDFTDFFVVLRAHEPGYSYPTLQAAQEFGAVTWNYGRFFNNVVAFLIVTLVMFFFIRFVRKVEEELDERIGQPVPEGAAPPPEKKCPYCRQVIAQQATRCPFCTSQFETNGS